MAKVAKAAVQDVRMLSGAERAAVLLLAGATAFAAEPAAGIKVPANQRFVLPNGLTIVLVPKKDVPLIAFSGFVRGGALSDPADKPGVASLVAGLLDRGAGKRSAFEFAEAVEGVGGSFNAAAGSESITVNGQFQPTIRSKAGQTEIWVLANVSEVVYPHRRL